MMTRNSIFVVQLAMYFEKEIALRSSFAELMEELQKEFLHYQRIELDFKNIEFVSRSVADQIWAEVQKLSQRNLNITFVNLGEEISKMLNVVEESRGKPRKKPLDLKITTFNEASGF